MGDSMKNYSPIILALLLLALSCKPRPDDPSSPTTPKLSSKGYFEDFDLYLPNTPVVKMVGHGNSLWVMTENIAVMGDQDDYPRSVKMITPNKIVASIEHAIKGDEYLTDIALGPKANQIWVSYVWPKSFDAIGVRIIDKEKVVWETKIPMPQDAPNPAQYTHRLGALFDPNFNSIDQVRMVSDNKILYVVARNNHGVPFLFALEHQKTVKEPYAIAPAYFKLISRRFSGVYSVMDQLNAATKLHIANCRDTLAIVWQPSSAEINNNNNFYRQKIEKDSIEGNSYVSVIEINKNSFTATSPQLHFISDHDTMVQALTCYEQTAVIAGLSRNKPNGLSTPFIIKNAQLSFLTDEFSTSTSIQAVILQDKHLIFGGSTQWQQNPHGLSIDSGKGYLKAGGRLMVFGSPRTELRNLIRMGAQLCYGGMIDGPTTHSHDNNPSSIKGNGFVKCQNLASIR